jgi:hypothetical protein
MHVVWSNGPRKRTHMQLKARKCSRCEKEIPWGSEHIRHIIYFTNGSSDSRHYCWQCCLDPALAVMFADVMGFKQVKRMTIDVIFR